jgi:hypothetical protein
VTWRASSAEIHVSVWPVASASKHGQDSGRTSRVTHDQMPMMRRQWAAAAVRLSPIFGTAFATRVLDDRMVGEEPAAAAEPIRLPR